MLACPASRRMVMARLRMVARTRAGAGGADLGAVFVVVQVADPVGYLRQSLALHRQVGNPFGQAEALNGLGQAFLAAGQAGQANRRHADALALEIQCSDKHEQARAHNGLASACQATTSRSGRDTNERPTGQEARGDVR